jgi:hypothetical protein
LLNRRANFQINRAVKTHKKEMAALQQPSQPVKARVFDFLVLVAISNAKAVIVLDIIIVGDINF